MNLKFLFFISIIFVLFFSPLVFAEWYEAPEIRVLDNLGRVVPNASVYIKWEISKGAGNATTKTEITNERGRAYFKLYNREFNPADENRVYTVYVSYQGKNYSKEFSAGYGSFPRTINIDAYLTSFYLKDKEGKPLSTKLLIDYSYEIFTDSKGRADIILNRGEHIIKPIFFDLEQTQKIKVENDTKVDLEVELYSLFLRIVDDNGVPLSGVKVSIGPFSYKTDSQGTVAFSNITKQLVAAEINYQKYSLSEVFNLSNLNLTYVLDTHPPIISDITTQTKNNLLQIRAIVSDPGKYPSGFNSNKAKVNLKYYLKDDVERTLPMYAVGYTVYEAILKLEPDQKNIKYSIEASDSFGNTAFSSDVFILERSKEKTSKEELIPPVELLNLSKFDLSILIYPFILGILIAVGIYLYKHKFKKEEQKPPSEYSYSEKEKKPPSKIFSSIPKKTT